MQKCIGVPKTTPYWYIANHNNILYKWLLVWVVLFEYRHMHVLSMHYNNGRQHWLYHNPNIIIFAASHDDRFPLN